jgi:hypothetical protein
MGERTDLEPEPTEQDLAPPVVPAGPEGLYRAKLAVMAEVPYVLKVRTQGLNYSFASESELIRRLHPAMVRAGLTVCQTDQEVVGRERIDTAKGGRLHWVLMRVTYCLTHAGTKETETHICHGEAADSGDKAINKASTAAYKDFLRRAFVVETGDDPDRYSSDEMEEAPAGAPKQTRPPARQSPPTAPPAAQAGPTVQEQVNDMLARIGEATGPELVPLREEWLKRFAGKQNALRALDGAFRERSAVLEGREPGTRPEPARPLRK